MALKAGGVGGPRFVAATDGTKPVPPAADATALETEIDGLAFDLYGLTPEERETVKGGGK